MKCDLFSYIKARQRQLFTLAVFAIVFASLFAPTLALAQQSLPTLSEIQGMAGSADGADADTSRLILMRLFGDFGVSPFTSTGVANTLLGTLFFTFNSVIFVVGTSYIGYQIIMAIASSAHEGEILGKRMNSLWAPIRLGVGVFGMLPVFKGFSLAQSVILGTALLGIGMANMMVDKTVDSADQFNSLIPPPGLVNVSGANGSVTDEIAHSLFTMNVCVLASQKYLNGLENLPIVNKWAKPKIESNNIGVETKGLFLDCGSVKINDQSDQMRTDDGFLRKLGFGGFRTPAVDYKKINETAKGAVAIRRETLHKVQNDIQGYAQTWYNSISSDTPEPYPLEDITNSLREHLKKEEDKVKELISSTSGNRTFRDGITDRIKEGGWLSIGSWYATFAEQDAAIQSAFVANHMEINQPNLSRTNLPPDIQDPLLRVFTAREKALASDDNKGCALGMQRNAVGECNWGQGLAMAILGGLSDGGAGMVNPITTAKNIGDYMLSAVGWAAIAHVGANALPPNPVKGALKGASAAVEQIGPLSKAKDYFLGMVGKVGSTLLMAFLVLGLVFAVYIPLIPFITWFTAVVSYFASVVEGLVGAQVWAFSHLSSEGEGMGQRTEKGYVYILNMLLRPGLMVLGFFFASALMTLMATFMFQQLGTAIANMQGDTNTGPIIIMGLLFVYMILLITLIQTLCNLIYEIPDRVISWFGHSMEAKLAQNMDRMSEQKMDQATRWAGHSAIMQMGK